MSNNVFELVETLRGAINQLNQIMMGDETASVTIGGVTKPSISKAIDDAFGAIQAAVSGRLAFETKAAMDASLAHAANTLAEVWNDATTSNNGVYGKVGASGTGSWAKSPYDVTMAFKNADIELSSLLAGFTNLAVGSDTTPSYSRGSYTATGLFTVNTIFGWRSPFKHNGSAFDAVRMSLKTSSAAVFRIEITRADGTLLASGNVWTSGATAATVYTVPLNRLVTDLAADEVAFIKYYHPAATVWPSYPAAGAYDAADANPSTYTEQYYIASKVWTNATPAGNYRTNFELINLAVAGRAARTRLESTGVNANKEIRWGFVPYVMWQHPRGDSEMAGEMDYAFGNAIGMYEQITEASIINAVQYRIWASQSVDVEWKLWVRDTTTPFNMNSTAADASGTVAAGSFPTVNTLYKLQLPSNLSVAANKYVFVMFRAVNNSAMYIRRWTTASSNPARHSWPMTVSGGGWDQTFAFASAPAYCQAAARFLLESQESRSATFGGSSEQVSYSGSGIYGSNVKAAIDELSQTEIVMPPYVFGVQGRECNVYLDNLLLDDVRDYQIGVTAPIGTLQDERWTTVPSAVLASGLLTITAHQKRTGKAITSKSAELRVAASTAGSGLNKKVLVIGDSLTSAGVITQTMLDIAGPDAMDVTLVGTRGSGSNKHEGRGGWTVADYSTVGRTYYSFTVSGVVTPPDINSTEYSHNGSVYRVQELYLSDGAGTVVCSVTSGGAPLASGTLTKTSGNGDASIAFSASAAVSGNPFWHGGAVNFATYLSTYSVPTPDWVFIMLGTNDMASHTTDAAALAAANTAFANLDILIASIKAASPGIKVGVMIPPPPSATQDSFGNNYGTSLWRWRFKRNILVWARQLISRYVAQEVNRIYVVPANTALDTVNNMMRGAAAPANSRTTVQVSRQSNGVHPDTGGYQQIADAVWAFLKYYA